MANTACVFFHGTLSKKVPQQLALYPRNLHHGSPHRAPPGSPARDAGSEPKISPGALSRAAPQHSGGAGAQLPRKESNARQRGHIFLRLVGTCTLPEAVRGGFKLRPVRQDCGNHNTAPKNGRIPTPPPFRVARRGTHHNRRRHGFGTDGSPLPPHKRWVEHRETARGWLHHFLAPTLPAAPGPARIIRAVGGRGPAASRRPVLSTHPAAPAPRPPDPE